MRIYRWSFSLRESDVLKIAPFLRRRLHGISSYNFSHPHLWFSETYMKGRRNNCLSGNRNSPFVGKLQRTRILNKHIDHHLHSVAKFKHICSSRMLAYVPNELSLLMLCQKWEQEWAPAIREYRLVEKRILWDKILSETSEKRKEKKK